MSYNALLRYKDPGRFLLIYHQQLLKDQEKYAHIPAAWQGY